MLFYKQQISEIEHFLKKPAATDIYSPQTFHEILKTQHHLFISLSARLAEVHKQLADLIDQTKVSLHSSESDVFSDGVELFDETRKVHFYCIFHFVYSYFKVSLQSDELFIP